MILVAEDKEKSQILLFVGIIAGFTAGIVVGYVLAQLTQRGVLLDRDAKGNIAGIFKV